MGEALWISVYVYMTEIKSKNPLHGITLAKMVTDLQVNFGWPRLGEEINIKCFTNNPSVKSSLVFLRRTPWARKKVENLYLDMINGRISRTSNHSPVRRTSAPIEKIDKTLWPDLEL